MAFDEWIEKAHGKENHAPHPVKRVLVSDTAHGYFLTVCRGDKLIERRGPSNSLKYITTAANEHCGFSDEPKRPTFIDREGEKTI
jgi:hypothetical protein